MVVRRAENDDDFARLCELLDEYERGLPEDLRHGGTPGPTAAREIYAEPNAAFLAQVGARSVGCVGLVRHDASAAIVQRLYTEPAYRGLGAGRALVTGAVELARLGGYRRVVLDTDAERLADAVRLYRSLGFTECEAYGQVDYPGPTFMELKL